MSNFVEKIGQEWTTISQAPFIFLAILILAVGLAWWVFRYLHAAELTNKNSQLQLANDRLADYQRKLDVDSPEEARQQMRKLENKVSELADQLKRLGPRRLSEEQKRQIISAISISAGSCVAITKDGASPDAATLSSDLVDAFRRGGWEVSTPVVLGLGNPPPSGVAIELPEPKNRNVAQQAIVNAFEAANIAYDIQPFRERPAQEANKPIAEITLTTSATR